MIYSQECKVFYSIIDSLPGIWCYFNPENSELHFNDEACCFFEVKNKNVFLEPEGVSNHRKLLINNSNLLFEFASKIKENTNLDAPLIEYFSISESTMDVFLVRVTQMFDTHHNNGFLLNLLNLSKTKIPCLCVMLANGMSIVNKNIKECEVNLGQIRISRREHLVLFLTIYGKSRMEIAESLNICVSTVDSYNYNLKNKFNALSKNELIQKAIYAGFGASIPAELVPAA